MGGGLKATPPLENFKKGTPPKNFQSFLAKILEKIAKFGGKTAKF
jgi:hypothetical protein